MAASACAAMLCLTGACAHNNSVGTADKPPSGQVSGEIRPEVASTTAVPGPAVQDSTGRVYVSSAAGGTGNAATVGTNTNVTVTPQSSNSTVAVTQTPVVTTVETPTMISSVET